MIKYFSSMAQNFIHVTARIISHFTVHDISKWHFSRSVNREQADKFSTRPCRRMRNMQNHVHTILQYVWHRKGRRICILLISQWEINNTRVRRMNCMISATSATFDITTDIDTYYTAGRWPMALTVCSFLTLLCQRQDVGLIHFARCFAEDNRCYQKYDKTNISVNNKDKGRLRLFE